MIYFFIIVGFTAVGLLFTFVHIWLNKQDEKVKEEIKPMEKKETPVIPIDNINVHKPPHNDYGTITPKLFGLRLCNRKSYSHKKSNKKKNAK